MSRAGLQVLANIRREVERIERERQARLAAEYRPPLPPPPVEKK